MLSIELGRDKHLQVLCSGTNTLSPFLIRQSKWFSITALSKMYAQFQRHSNPAEVLKKTNNPRATTWETGLQKKNDKLLKSILRFLKNTASVDFN